MIPGVPSVGGEELLIVLAIILLFFGGSRLPQLGRSVGSGIRELRQGLAGGSSDDDKEVVQPGEQKSKQNKRQEEEDEPTPNGAVDHTEVSHGGMTKGKTTPVPRRKRLRV
jgi:sec-independent protein translocase protein TatA